MNTTDTTRGETLKTRVQARKQELEVALGQLAQDDHTKPFVERALAEINGLLSGDLDQIPHVIAVQLNTWLESNKHVDDRSYAV